MALLLLNNFCGSPKHISHLLKPLKKVSFSTSSSEMTSDGKTAIVPQNCTFCDIIQSNDMKIMHQDELVAVFPDIKPAAKHHYLIVSKEHILNAKHLTKEHKSLVEHMMTVGKKVLEDKGGSIQSTRFGFHWPPVTSIEHLHLHVISPIEDLNFLSKLIFRPSDMWFVSPEYVLARLDGV